ncbi:MAG: tRNA uridine-5-carboxymethylaminomethyl(34) synthesis GTPase MnmE [Gammaproteobacteria bacterium]|nr:tRNA uridine-5-carboxymethylaminomethyl(34) synthesis GTPase MnmE [Gammaproteobacteria bacterium]
MSVFDDDTICAIATGSARGGIGVVRVSGPETLSISKQILGFDPKPRYAHSCNFLGVDGVVVDSGIAIFFQGPNSFTGEDTLELQGHGGLYILNEILETVLSLNSRLARPGEFTERSFLNGKIDLLQAEAIADLIDAGTKQLARSATRTLQGDFSGRIKTLQDQLTHTRVNVEAAIDFSDEEITIISSTKLTRDLKNTLEDLDRVFEETKQGIILREGQQAVIIGKPNVGKSSLLNTLAGEESAIVTNIPGTTRDVLKVEMLVDGVPIHLSDTAGLRLTSDPVEQEGINRARQTIENADHILLVIDAGSFSGGSEKLALLVNDFVNEFSLTSEHLKNLTVIVNKIDLLTTGSGIDSSIEISGEKTRVISLSAKMKTGIDKLRHHLKSVGQNVIGETGNYSARIRHTEALEEARTHIIEAKTKASDQLHLELVAEDLRLAQKALGIITGELTSDDLLGEIFSNFCVGK